MYPGKQHLAVVISPLRSLIRDQVQQCRSKRITAMGILGGEEHTDDEIEGVCSPSKNYHYAMLG